MTGPLLSPELNTLEQEQDKSTLTHIFGSDRILRTFLSGRPLYEQPDTQNKSPRFS